MNTSKNTPGPYPLTVRQGERFIIVTNQGNHYASTFDPAAARLISAAPELLAALEYFADRLPGIIRECCPQGVPVEVGDAHKAALAALAKARGAA